MRIQRNQAPVRPTKTRLVTCIILTAITSYQSLQRHKRITGVVKQAHPSLATFLQSLYRVSRSKNSITVKVSLQEAEGIRCNDFRIQSFYSFFRFPFILWLKVRRVCNRIHAEMALIQSTLQSWRRLRLEKKICTLAHQGKHT